MSRREGFTLVELLLCLAVLGLGLAILFTLLPAAASTSRSQRDELRVGEFVDAVFESLAWQIDAEGTVSPRQERLKLPTVAGDQVLQINTNAETLFPEMLVPEGVVPRLYYTLTVSEIPGALRAELSVRPMGQPTARTFTRILAPQRRPW